MPPYQQIHVCVHALDISYIISALEKRKESGPRADHDTNIGWESATRGVGEDFATSQRRLAYSEKTISLNSEPT